MATKQTKQTKSAPVNTFALAIRATHDTFVSTFVGWAENAVEAQARRHTFAERMLAALVALREAAPDTGAYLTALADECGNGLKGKERKPGAIYDAVTSALAGKGDTFKAERTWQAQLAMARAVGSRLADPVQLARVKKDGTAFRTLYDESKKTKAPSVKADDPTQPGKLADVTLDNKTPKDIVQQVVVKIGVARIIEAVADIMAADNATKLEALTLRAMYEKFTKYATK